MFNFSKNFEIIKLISILLLSSAILKSQPINLINNPSFEFYDTCTGNSSNISDAPYWYGGCGIFLNPPFINCGSGSSDYFHFCQGFMPNNLIGTVYSYQYPRTGIGMAGAGIVFIPNNEGREYICTFLDMRLKKAKNYCGSFYINSADKFATQVSGIGAYFSKDTLIQQGFFDMFNVPASIQSPIDEVLTDSVGWTCIKGIYTAQGDEFMMTVGSFLPWDSMQYIALNPPPFDYGYAYYFFDDFSVVELPDFSLTQSEDSICRGDSVLLKATTTNLWNGLQHRWYAKGNNMIKDSLLLQTIVKPTQTTTYYFQFFDTINEVPCLVDYIDSVTVFVKPIYNLILSPTDTIICAGKGISIGVDELAGLQYQWEPTAYLSNAQSSKTIANPTNTITYTLTTLADSINRQCLGINSASVQIEVIACEPTEAPIIPNVLLYGNTLEIKNLHRNSTLKIYDEIGQIIYENNNYQNNWQAFVSSGVYFLSLSYMDIKGDVVIIKVKFTVIR